MCKIEVIRADILWDIFLTTCSAKLAVGAAVIVLGNWTFVILT